MSSTKNPGRVAGLYYLLLIAVGPLFLIYIPDKLYVKGNAAATVSNIAAHERLFRFGILAELVGGVILIFLVLAFYRLFQGVDPHLAVLVIILGGIMPAVMYFVNVAYELGALIFAQGADFLFVFDKPQRDALAMVLLRLHSFQIDASLVLAGAWLFPLAMLVPVTFSTALPGSLAGHRRLRLVDFELCGNTRTAISKQTFRHPSARLFRGDSPHPVARHQGSQAASAPGRCSLIVGLA